MDEFDIPNTVEAWKDAHRSVVECLVEAEETIAALTAEVEALREALDASHRLIRSIWVCGGGCCRAHGDTAGIVQVRSAAALAKYREWEEGK